MSDSKDSVGHVELDHHQGQALQEHGEAGLYHRDGGVLLDIGAKGIEMERAQL